MKPFFVFCLFFQCCSPSSSEPPEWEDFDEEDDVVDLRAYNVVGGVFTFDLLDLPPQPKVCKNWVITQREFIDQDSSVCVCVCVCVCEYVCVVSIDWPALSCFSSLSSARTGSPWLLLTAVFLVDCGCQPYVCGQGWCQPCVCMSDVADNPMFLRTVMLLPTLCLCGQWCCCQPYVCVDSNATVNPMLVWTVCCWQP